MATVQERVAALQKKAADKRIADAQTSSVDQADRAQTTLNLRTRAAEAGISTKGGVVVETRGQRLAADNGQNTAFRSNEASRSKGRTAPFAGAKSSEFVQQGDNRTFTTTDFANAPRPRQEENETPQQFALRSAQFDANQFKQAFEAEKKLTSQVKDQQSLDASQRSEVAAKQNADKLRARTAVNPEFTKLTSEQKQLNRQRKEQGLPFIEEKISADTGRAAIDDPSAATKAARSAVPTAVSAAV